MRLPVAVVHASQEFTAGLASMVSEDSDDKDEVLKARLRLAFAVFDADDK